MRCWDAATGPGAGCPRARPRSLGGTGEAEAEAESGRSSTKRLAPRHREAAAGELRTTERPRALPGPVPRGGIVLGQGSETGEKWATWDQPRWLCPAAAHGSWGAPCPGGVSASEAGPGVPMLQGPPPGQSTSGKGRRPGQLGGQQAGCEAQREQQRWESSAQGSSGQGGPVGCSWLVAVLRCSCQQHKNPARPSWCYVGCSLLSLVSQTGPCPPALPSPGGAAAQS